jgi:hypothetical protein
MLYANGWASNDSGGGDDVGRSGRISMARVKRKSKIACERASTAVMTISALRCSIVLFRAACDAKSPRAEEKFV